MIELYDELMEKYGPQGWWPLLDCEGSNPTKTGCVKGYHPGDFSYPNDDKQRFEICIGAILTQNTAWPNVEKALINLSELHSIDPVRIIELDREKLRTAIRPAGYFNQKAKKLKIFADFYMGKKDAPKRDELLELWGVGPETADSILLYAYKVPTFVVDAYTRRLLVRKGMISGDEKYDEIKGMFEDNLPRDFKLYQEFHALIVEDAKHQSKRS